MQNRPPLVVLTLCCEGGPKESTGPFSHRLKLRYVGIPWEKMLNNTKAIKQNRKTNPITSEQKKAEGAYLREHWEVYKRTQPGMTQEKFSEKLEITQGLLQQIFKGMTPCPNWLLIEMSIEFRFDPRAVRPTLALLTERLTVAINKADEDGYGLQFSMLPRDIQREGLNYASYLLEQRNRENGE